MKKRFISKLLMGALVVATMGVFSSCKDYDDDINANTALINQLQAQVKALEEAKATQATEISKAETAISEAQTAISEAVAQIQQAEKDWTEAIAKGDEAAVKKAQELIEASEAKVLAAAKEEAAQIAAAAAAQAKLDAIADADAKLAALTDVVNQKLSKEEFETVLATLATKEGLNEALKPLMADIAALQEGLAANGKADEALQKKLDDFYAEYLANKETVGTAIADLSTTLTALGVDVKLIDGRLATVEANYATKTALEQALLQVAANKQAIEDLDAKVNKLDEDTKSAIAKLATKEELAAAQKALQDAIDKKADQTALDTAIATINETIKTLATKQELADEVAAINTVLTNIQNLLATKASTEELTAAKNELQGKINELGIKEQADIDALRSELMGVIELNIANVNSEITRQIGIVDGRITTEINTVNGTITSNYNTLLGLINACAKSADLTDATNRITALETTQGNIESTVNNIVGQLNSLTNELNNMANELNKLNDLEVDVTPARLQAGENVNNAVAALKKVLEAMNDKINNMHKYLESTVGDVNSKLDQIKLFVTKNLTSLVYRPEGDNAYLYGFPTIKATLLKAQVTYTFTKDRDGKEVNPVPSTDESSKQFDIVAKYWVNPSSTDVTKYKFQFDEVPSRNTILRGNRDHDKANITANVIEYKDQILSVALKIANGENVNDAKSFTETVGGENQVNAWLTTVALQATRNDADIQSIDTVTSDYAVIVPEYISELVLANKKYATTGTAAHEEGNKKFHLNKSYNATEIEDNNGIFSYELAYNEADAKVDLTTIDIHYNGDVEVMGHKDAELRGFKFKYTFIDNKEYFTEPTEDNQTIAIKEDKRENTSVGKVAVVRVELQADGKTFAYGFLSIIITSPKVETTVKLDDLQLICNADKTTWKTDANTVATGVKWTTVKKQIEDAIGVEGALANYDWATQTTATETEANIKKWKSASETATEATDIKGKIAVDKAADTFTWTFTEAEVYNNLFYDSYALKNQTPKTNYSAILRLTPKAGHPELSNVFVTVQIPKEVYPTGAFSYDQRIQQYWFKQGKTGEKPTIATTASDRYEIHGNVEVVDQEVAGVAAADRFTFNIAGSFFNGKYDQAGYDNKYAILIDKTNGFSYKDLATVYFDADKYYIYNAADEGKTVAAMKNVAPKTSFATGMSGAEYLLFIDTRDATVLKAVKGKLVTAEAQPVVELTEDYNAQATYQGWTYYTGLTREDPADYNSKITAGNALDYAYAYDLLNKSDHNEVGEGETFTTHMMLDQRDYCFPIDFLTANKASRFDIKWLRPISVDEQDNHEITDAVDKGTVISLAEHTSFIDWRDIKFSASLRLNYINYYGIRAIKPNLDKAVTDINGGWTNIKYFPALQFEDLTTEGTGTYTDKADFVSQLGVVKYTNNGLNVGTFKIKMPVTLLYDWGETAEQVITFTIKKTTGQDITARQH